MDNKVEDYLGACIQIIQNDADYSNYYTKALCILKAGIMTGQLDEKNAEMWRSRLDNALRLRKVTEGN